MVEAIKVLLYLKKYINLKDPAHQYMNVLEMVFLYSKSVLTCRSMCICPGNPCVSGQRTEWREREYRPRSVQHSLVCGQAGALFFLKKTSGPSSLEGNTFFMPICNLHQLMKCTRTLRTQNMVSLGQVERVLSSEHNASYFHIRNTWKFSKPSQV